MTDSNNSTTTSIGKMIANSASHASGGGGVHVDRTGRDGVVVPGGGGYRASSAASPPNPPSLEEKPSRVEVWGWNLYGWCTYLVEMALIPVIFPLIISQVVDQPPEPPQGWSKSARGFSCRTNELRVYEGLTHKSINNSSISPLEWTSVSWVIGLVFAAPTLAFLSPRLDYGQYQQLIAGAATVVGAVFCLPSGFFRTPYIFLIYISVIVVAYTVSSAAHTRNLGLMIRGFTGPVVRKDQFQVRRSVSGWLSLYATAAGCFSTALISAFTYHMLEEKEKFISLWVVSIFSGLAWLLGILYVIVAYRPGSDDPPSTASFFSILGYPHALGTLVGVFLSSFTIMCIFTGGVLYLVGELCVKPVFLLYFWLTYFLFPIVSLPLLHPFQNLIKANAVKMKLLGFLLSMVTAAVGFYCRNKSWNRGHIVFFGMLQSTAAGILYSYGRVLVLDCSPSGREGAFSSWYTWVRSAGSCVGFAIAAVAPGKIGTSFGVAFVSALLGAVMFVFANVSDIGAAKAAGHVNEDHEKPMHALEKA
ncbi:hypothetical protein MLD38_037773 [Melastoma candidum]|uniref:Uncharacterized protein n=1 Tax=Melastoma candidum TaxID=119954 RepID=A0ACB9LNP3_9MYRT|nr:hypothetical protein MLD38_037773 [Melastoma candidum]